MDVQHHIPPKGDQKTKNMMFLILASLMSSACSSDAQSLGSFVEFGEEPVSKITDTQQLKPLANSAFDIRITDLASSANCPGGGLKVELWQNDSKGQPVLFQERLECAKQGELRWVKVRDCQDMSDSNCLLVTQNPPNDSVHQPPASNSSPPQCTQNFQKNCISNETFPAGQIAHLTPDVIKNGVTIAGVVGQYTGDINTCASNGAIGCITNTDYRSADWSQLTPENIKAGKTVAGVTGVYPSQLAPLEGSEGQDLPSLASNVPAGIYQFFKSDGTRIVGSVSDAGAITPSSTETHFDASLYRGFTVSGDGNLHSDNILAGVPIFGITGNVALPPTSKVESGTFFGPQGNTFAGDILQCDTAGATGCITTETLKPYPVCTMNGQVNCATNSTFQSWKPVTAVVTAGASSADEGATVDFSIATTNVPDGTVFQYQLSGNNINQADLTSGTTTGQTTISDNQSSVSVAIKEDFSPEGEEVLTLTVFQPIASENVAINDTSSAYIPDPSLTLAWYDASDASTISLTGEFVAQWRDLGPHGFHLNQATPAYQPSYRTSGWNNGSRAYLDWGTAPNGKYLTTGGAVSGVKEVFAVADFDSATISNYHGILSGSTTIGMITNAGPSGWYASGAFASNFYPNGASTPSMTTLPTISTPFLIHARSNNAINLASLIIGLDREYTSLDRGWIGKIAEIIIYDQALTPEIRARTEGYLAWKWGFQDKLDPGHPYYSAGP